MNQTNSSLPKIIHPISPGFNWQNYLAVFVSGFGLFTNLVNIAVFLNRRLKDTNYRYLFSKSMANLFYLSFSFLNEFFKNCTDCDSTKTFFANLYVITITSYLAYCLAIFRILVEVTLSIRTFCHLENNFAWFNKIPYKFTITTLFAVSLLYYAQKPFACVILSFESNENSYYTAFNDFGKSETFSIISIVQQAVRIFLAFVLLTLINAVNLIKFRKRFNNLRVGFTLEPTTNRAIQTISSSVKSTMSLTFYNSRQQVTRLTRGESKLIKDVTRMVIFSTFINVICEMPFTVITIVQLAGVNSPDVKTARRLCGILFAFSPMFDMFSYSFFNKHYRYILSGYLLLVIKFIFRIE